MTKKILLALAAMAFVFGCSEAPEEYDKNTVINNDRPHEAQDEAGMFETLFSKAQTLSSASGDISTEDLLDFDPSSFQPGGEEFDKKVKFNASQPMVYAVGASGMTFKTTYEESREIAVPRTPPNINGDAQYDENMVVRWRPTAPRTPVAFTLFSGYTGDVQVPAPFAPFKLKHDFSNQYTANTVEGARKMTRDFYNMFEGKDAGFDCLSVGYCVLDWGPSSQENFVVVLPGMQLLISKDRFVVFVIRVAKVVPQGPLNSDIDMLTGKFLINGEEFPELAGQTIAIGDSVESIDKKLNITTETSASTDLFGRNYSGIFLGYQRTQFGREDEQPVATDVLKMIQVYRDYKKNLTIGGYPVIVREYTDKIELSVSTAKDFVGSDTGGYRELPLAISLGLKRKNVRDFAFKMKDFLAAELTKAYPKASIVPHLTGTQQNKEIKNYNVFVFVYDSVAKAGKFVQVSIGEEDGNLLSFFTLDVGEKFNAFDTIVGKELTSPIEKTVTTKNIISEFGNPILDEKGQPKQKTEKSQFFTEISGFAIGQVVKVSNWDLGRSQADVAYERDGVVYKDRSDYSDRAVLNVAYDVTEKVKPQDQASVGISSLTVTLGLTPKPISETATERVYKIISISTPYKFGEVRDLCGSEMVSFKVGTPATEVLTKLQQTSCAYKLVNDVGGNGRLEYIYFPQDRIRLNFGDLELAGFTVYSPANEVL